MEITVLIVRKYLQKLLATHCHEFTLTSVNINNNGDCSITRGIEHVLLDNRKLLVEIEANDYYGYLLVHSTRKYLEIITFQGVILKDTILSLIIALGLYVDIKIQITPYFPDSANKLYYIESRVITHPSSYMLFLEEMKESLRQRDELSTFYLVPNENIQPIQIMTSNESIDENYSMQNNDSPLDYPFGPKNTNISSFQNKGIIFCHGHVHSFPEMPSFIRNIQWTLVDSSSYSNPDIIGTFGSMKILKQLGLYQYDYVMSYHLSGDEDSLYRGARLLLNKKGKFITNNLQHFSEKRLNKIKTNNYYSKVYKEERYVIFDA